MADLFDTRKEPEAARMAYWLETVCQQILPVKIDPRHDARPQAAMACAEIGALRLRDVVGGDHVYVRDARDVRRGDPETLQVGMPLRGSSILVQDGREAVLQAGDMVLYDSSRPFSLVMQDRFHWQVFLLPKSKLRRSDRELAELTAVRMDAAQGVTGLVHGFLRQLAKDVGRLERDPAAEELAENAADLVATMVLSQFGRQWRVGDPDAVLREQVKAFLVAQHPDPHLAPTAVAAHLGVSVRRLHQAFTGSGTTVMDQLRSVRLTSIRRDLCDPRLAHRAISRVAAAHGMANPAAFTRAFREAFGVTPSETRALALEGRGSTSLA